MAAMLAVRRRTKEIRMPTQIASHARFTATRRATGAGLAAFTIALAGTMLTLAARASPVAPQPEKAVKPAGVEVQVTAEMTGAGMVSSGVKLPAIPPVTGDRRNPVPSWGKPLPYPIAVSYTHLLPLICCFSCAKASAAADKIKVIPNVFLLN